MPSTLDPRGGPPRWKTMSPQYSVCHRLFFSTHPSIADSPSQCRSYPPSVTSYTRSALCSAAYDRTAACRPCTCTWEAGSPRKKPDKAKMDRQSLGSARTQMRSPGALCTVDQGRGRWGRAAGNPRGFRNNDVTAGLPL